MPKMRGSMRLTSGIATVSAANGMAASSARPKSAAEGGVGRMTAHLPRYATTSFVHRADRRVAIVVIIGFWVAGNL